MEKLYISTSVEETKEIAATVLKSLGGRSVICLYGNLAAGKTTFSQGIGDSLGIKRVVSPTYMIMRQYSLELHPVYKQLFHLDLYRLNSPDEVRAFDIDEILSDKSNLTIIEWPEKFLDILPNERCEVYLKENGPVEREIKVLYL